MPRSSDPERARRALTQVAEEISALATLSTAELLAKHEQLCGSLPARRTRDVLIKLLALALQRRAEEDEP